MKNKLGTTENMVEYHENGKKSYEFITDSDGVSEELTFDKHERILTTKASNSYTDLLTRDEHGNELTFKNSDGYYRIKGIYVTKEEYEAFIQSLEKPKEQIKEQTVVEELIDEIQQEIIKSANRTGEYRIGLIKAIDLANEKLEKEKEQIIHAYEFGYKSCDIDEAFEINKKLASGEKYYNQTYNQNK